MNDIPTLLVGLGGIGSRIVNDIYGMIPVDKRSRIAVHIFDTNVNDISKLDNLDKDWRTQTSKDMTVEQYLYNLGEAEEFVKDWFPHEQREIRRKSLTEGAGQVRAISRLGYRAAMQEGKLNELHRQLTAIFRETGESETKSARVMIINSLAGGTGAGIFLQTAMYLREVLKFDYKRSNVLIRGAFLLPDILALTSAVSKGEIENIRANAYASIKELNAIIKNTSANDVNSDRVEIELEYKPNQVDVDGRLNHTITYDQLPYDFCFLYDFENSAKNNLQYPVNYFRQVAQCTYLELFSPIAGDKFSRQDNQILELVKHEGLNRYCGAGVARLIYPYEENIKYFALKWATDSLSNDWLKIDQDFEQEYKQYEQDLHNGVNRDEPKIHERYVWLLDSMAKDERPQPFFKVAHRDGYSIGKENQPETAKADLFLRAVEDEIDRIIGQDAKLNALQSETEIDDNRLNDKNRMKEEVLNVEGALRAFENEINKFVLESKTFISAQIYLQDCDQVRFADDKDHKLNTWIMKRDHPVHPVTVRYIMYQIYSRLEHKLRSLTTENKDLQDSIGNYGKAYDLPETDDLIEDAHDRIEAALKQNVFQRMVGKNELKEFTEEYYEKASRQRQNLIKYKKQRLMELVFADLKKAVREMLDNWERYFKNLRNVRNSLLQDLNKYAVSCDKASDPTVKYILGSKELKEKLWDITRTYIKSTGFPREILEQIYIGQYSRFCRKQRSEYVKDEPFEKVETMFRQDVVGWCRRELRKQESLDMNCIEAMRREIELTGVTGAGEGDRLLGEHIKMLDRLARPFVPDTVDTNHLDAWGVHPDNIEELTGEQKNEWFATDLNVNDSFPKYEIIRYKSNYNLKIEHFPKFLAPSEDGGRNQPGVYFTAYTNRINRLMNKGNTVTPHLDKRWHLPTFLPDLNPGRDELERLKIDRSMITGIIMGYLRNVDNYGNMTWEFFEEKNSRVLKVRNESVDKYTHSLHAALDHNPVIVEKALKLFERQQEEDTESFQIKLTSHTFCKGCMKISYRPAGRRNINILDLVLRYSEDAPSDSSLPEKETTLLEVLLMEIFAYYRYAYGSHRKSIATAEAVNFIGKLKEGSLIYNEADRDSSRFQRWEQLMDATIKEQQKS